MLEILISSGGSLAIFGAVSLIWWNIDKVIAKAKREEIGAKITGLDSAPEWTALQDAAYEMMRNTVSPQLPFGRFSNFVLASVLCGLLVFLIAYFSIVSGFASQIVTDQFAFWRVVRSVVAYGVPVALLCTYVSFFLQGVLIASIERSSIRGLVFYLVFDVAVRLAVFAALSALIFAYFAKYHGSFGGSVPDAIGAVPATIASAITFSNIAGVYFYAAMFSTFPLFVLLTLKILVRSKGLQSIWEFVVTWFPLAEKPLRFGVVVLAGCLAIAAFASSILLDAFSYYMRIG